MANEKEIARGENSSQRHEDTYNSVPAGSLGSWTPLFEQLSAAQPRRFSYLDPQWTDAEEWKRQARAVTLSHLRFQPPCDPLSPEILSRTDLGDHFREEIRFGSCLGMRISATLLLPKGEGPFPVVIGLHDHGGFYALGREKLIGSECEPETLRAFKQLCYEGASWATDFVRRGLAVIVIDAFFFGSRALDPATLPADAAQEYLAALEAMAADPNMDHDGDERTDAGSRTHAAGKADSAEDARIQAFNRLCGGFEPLVSKHFHTVGASWPGLIGFDDRRTVDYLLTRPEIDPNRIGCCGLSLGGYRSAFLAGTDSRIRCAAVVCWLPTLASLVNAHLPCHTFMAYAPGLADDLDLPDVAAMLLPNPLLVINGLRDPLFPVEGMRAAVDLLAASYRKAGAEESFEARFFDCGHVFSREMQRTTLDWFCRNLPLNG